MKSLLRVFGSTMLGIALMATSVEAANVVHLRKVQLLDDGIFGQRQEVLSMLIPMDWTFQASLNANDSLFASCPENAFQQRLQAESRDRLLGYALFPMLQTMYFQNPLLAEDARRRAAMGLRLCRQQQPMNLSQFVEQVLVPGFRPGARVLRTEPWRDWQQKIQREIADLQLPRACRSAAMQPRWCWDTSSTASPSKNMSTSSAGGVAKARAAAMPT